MSSFRVGTLSQSGIHLSNLDPLREAEARAYDRNGDGVLHMDEANRYYMDKIGQKAKDLSEVLGLLGGAQHVIKAYSQEAYTGAWGAGDWRGNFQLDVGAGNVRTGRQKSWLYVGNNHTQVDTTHFLVDCDLINQQFIERNVVAATLMIGPRNFPNEAHSQAGETVAVPLDIATIDAYHSYSRGGGGSYNPERKALAVSLDTADLRQLMGTADGLSFWVQLETDDGRRRSINLNGQAFNNFTLPANDLRADRA